MPYKFQPLAKMKNTIAITEAIVVTMNKKRQILDNATVVVQDDRIKSILPNGEWNPQGTEEIINASGKIVIPGLINCHMHSRPFRALGDDLKESEWHSRYAHTLSRLMDEESTYLGGLLAFTENIKGGITCAMNMPPSVAGSDRAAWEIGIRAVLCPHGGDDPDLKDANESLERSLENVENAGKQEGKRVRIWFGFGHPPECSKEYFHKMREYANEYDVGIHGHVASSMMEVALTKEKFGKPIVEYYYDEGFLGPDVILGHGVYLNEKERQMMAETGTKLTHCPSSNLKYGYGVTPVPEMLNQGICVGLGTDGLLSTYRLDMFEAMRLACFLQRIAKKDAAAFSALEALELATLKGAKTLGMESEIGSLETGKKADITLINFQQPHLAPLATGKHANIVALLVFSCTAADVDTVIIDGKVVLRNRKLLTADEKEIVSRVNEKATEVLSKVD